MGIKSPVSSTVNFGNGTIVKAKFGTVDVDTINFNGSLLWAQPVIELHPFGSTSLLASTVAGGWTVGTSPANTRIVYYILGNGQGAIGTLDYITTYAPAGSNIQDVTTSGTVHRMCTIPETGVITNPSTVVWNTASQAYVAGYTNTFYNRYTGVTTTTVVAAIPASYTWYYIGMDSTGKIQSGSKTLEGGSASSYTSTQAIINASTPVKLSITGTIPSLNWGTIAKTYDALNNIGMKFY
jgi:hypothetical protein